MALITTSLNGDGAKGVAYQAIKTQAAASKGYLIKQVALMQQVTCDAGIPLAVIQHFGSVIDRFNEWAATPGIAVYAQAQENDVNYNVVAEFNAMLSAFISVRDWLIGAFPKDGNGFLSYQVLNVSGQVSNRVFTQADLATAVTLIGTAIATIG